MSAQMMFVYKSGKGTVVRPMIGTMSVDTILEQVEWFLRECGFEFDGAIDVVEREDGDRSDC